MPYYHIMLPCLLFLINFLFKSSPRLIKNFLPKGDTFSHLYITKLVRQNKKIPKTLPHWLVDNYYHAPFTYPFLLHLILALFPTRWIEKFEKFIGPFINSCNVLIVYLFASIWLPYSWVGLAVFLYIISPISFLDDISLTPRPLGKLLLNLSILSSTVFFLNQETNILFPIIAIIFGSAVFLSHKFSSQAWFFTILFILIGTTLNIKIFIIITGILLILLIPLKKIYFNKILSDHIDTLRWHYENIKNKIKIFYTSHRITTKTIIGEYVNNPFFLLLIIFFAQNAEFFLKNPLYKLLLFWAFGLQVIAYLIKYPKKLRFLGEGDRYKYYNIFPVVFLITAYIRSHLTITNFILLAVSIIVSLFCLYYIIKNKILSSTNLLADKQLKMICQKLKKLSKDNVWEMGCIPPSIVMYLSNKKILSCLHSGTYFKEPNLFPEKNILNFYSYIINKYQINYLLIDKKCTSRNYKQMYKELKKIGNYKKIAEDGRYYILEIIHHKLK